MQAIIDSLAPTHNGTLCLPPSAVALNMGPGPGVRGYYGELERRGRLRVKTKRLPAPQQRS